MFITVVNMFKKSVNGHIFRGKYRLVRKVSKKSLETLVKEYELQENNMLLLRNPYLTMEQSAGHAKALNKTEIKIAKWNEEHTKNKMKPHVKIEDRINHLKVKECWD